MNMKNPASTPLLLILALALLWASIATYVSFSRGKQLNHSTSLIADMDRIKKEAEELTLRDREMLDKVFGNLHRCSAGINEVNQGYLSSISLSRKKAKITLVNRSSRPVRPKMDVLLLSKYGFVTSRIQVHWLMDQIQPGETRIEERELNLRFGFPVYYNVTFD